MINRTELVERLVLGAVPPVALSEATKVDHHRLITASLTASPAPQRVLASGRRRVAVAALAALVSTTGPALVAAAQQALPGDTLYGLKRGSENILVIFDRDIRARHRIAELGELVNTDHDLTEVLAEAETELAEVEDDALLARWSVLVASIDDSSEDEESGQADDDDAVTTVVPDDDEGTAVDDGDTADSSDDEQTEADEDQADTSDDQQTDTTDDKQGDTTDDEQTDTSEDQGGSDGDQDDSNNDEEG